VVTSQDHDQRLLHKKAERQVWQRPFPSKKSGIDFSFRKVLRKQWGILTRYHHVNVRQLVAQDPQSFRHPGQFVSSQKAHREAMLGRMNSSPRSFGSRINLELRHLRHFVAVAETESLTLAAKSKLHTSQPSLSGQIRY
jgi:hypothetical protein